MDYFLTFLGIINLVLASIGVITSQEKLVLFSITISFVLGKVAFLFCTVLIIVGVTYLSLLKKFIKGSFVISYPKKYFIVLFFYLFAITATLVIHPLDFSKSISILTVLFTTLAIYFIPIFLLKDASQILLFPRYIPIATMLLLFQIIYFITSNNMISYFNVEYLKFHYEMGIRWGRSNLLAGILATFIPLNFACFIVSKEIKWKIFGLIGIIGSLAGVIITGSLGAMLAIVLASIVFSLFYKKDLFCYLCIICLVLMIFFLLNFQLKDFILKRIETKLELFEMGNAARLCLWRGALEIFFNHPFLGAGFVHSRRLLFQHFPYIPSDINSTEYLPQAHNFILQSLIDTGMLGTFFLLLFYGIHIFNAMKFSMNKKIPKNIIVFIKCVSLSMGILVIHSLIEPIIEGSLGKFLFWFLMGFTFRICSLLK